MAGSTKSRQGNGKESVLTILEAPRAAGGGQFQAEADEDAGATRSPSFGRAPSDGWARTPSVLSAAGKAKVQWDSDVVSPGGASGVSSLQSPLGVDMMPTPPPAGTKKGGFSSFKARKKKKQEDAENQGEQPKVEKKEGNEEVASQYPRAPQKPLTWSSMFAAGDRLRYAQLSSRMESITNKLNVRWSFIGWQELWRQTYKNQRVHDDSPELAARKGPEFGSNGRIVPPKMSIKVVTQVKAMARRKASRFDEAREVDHDGIDACVVEPPLSFDFRADSTPNWTGGQGGRMIGLIRIVWGRDRTWHLILKEMGKDVRDMGTLVSLEDRGKPKHVERGDVKKASKLVLGLMEADSARWKWTFHSVYGGGVEQFESFREVLVSCIKENSGIMEISKRFEKAAATAGGAKDGLFKLETAVLHIQRMWRKKKGKLHRKAMLAQKHDKAEAYYRNFGAVQMQKTARAFFARKQHLKRRRDRQMECLSAVKLGDIDWVTLMITRKGVAVGFQDARGWTPLHHAADANQESVVITLLELGAWIEAQDNKGNTPLHIACLRKATGACRKEACLLGADLEAQNDQGWTPITKPALFLMPLLEGLSRQLLRSNRILANLYQEPSFSPRRAPDSRALRYTKAPGDGESYVATGGGDGDTPR
eukprot:CAMPEP_0114172078 /NCGR_PEP_ID=MMETSP0043_2-20121206/35056_1 /TAXON_ID=464988 /ORGANISM="Hemiselmis andersenii, Strain CCMP644" /LENGTH=648 /DNA_ID=CAMNT_0001269875 /DNA_START=12 /DNA_END=1956 /DNA_ORIENTATION=-